jgi:hypothetical protein
MLLGVNHTKRPWVNNVLVRLAVLGFFATFDVIGHFSKHPAELLQLLRTGSEIQLRWLSELTRKTKHFLGQLPH